MEIHKDSHLDHSLTAAQIEHIKDRFGARDGFFIETFELPEALGTVPCGLYGPLMGDAPLPSATSWETMDVRRERRGAREYESRVVDLPTRPTRTVTVIAGPHDGKSCVLFTVFGGPLTPKEPADPTLADDKRAESEDFWAQHALAVGGAS